MFISYITGADPGFQVRGGGALKKIVPSGGRLENCCSISCEKSRFYAKKSYFFQLRREAWTFLGYFVWKITILRQKIWFFPVLGGEGPPGVPPLAPPLHYRYFQLDLISFHCVEDIITHIYVIFPINSLSLSLNN
jgi:hypothetical protein